MEEASTPATHQLFGSIIGNNTLTLIIGAVAGLIAFYIYEKYIRKSEKEIEEEREDDKIAMYQFSDSQLRKARLVG